MHLKKKGNQEYCLFTLEMKLRKERNQEFRIKLESVEITTTDKTILLQEFQLSLNLRKNIMLIFLSAFNCI